MATLAEAVQQAQLALRKLDGVRAAPDVPPEQLALFPFIVAHPTNGSFTQAPAGAKQGLHSIAFDLHLARVDLPHDLTRLFDFVETIPNKLMLALNTDRWGSTISTFAGIRYEFATFEYAGQRTIGIRFIVEGIKIQSAVE